MEFSIIIPTKDRKEILNRSLRHLEMIENRTDVEVLIINDSKEPLVLEKPFLLNISIFRNPGNGVASARNFGAAKASKDWLIFMDDDMLVRPDTFIKLKPFCACPGDKCLNINWVYSEDFAAMRDQLPFLRYLHYYGFDSLEGWNKGGTWDRELFRVNGITSQFLLMQKTTFQKVKGYNDSFPFAGFEDHDFSKKLNEHQIAIYIDPANIIYHNEEDRIEVENWLERRKRGAITRRVAYELGYKEVELSYPRGKTIFYKGVYACRKWILWSLRNWPNIKILDKVYFLFVNILHGSYSYIGYTTQKQ